MSPSKRSGALRRLFDLCDDLQRINTKMTDPDLGRDVRTQLRRQNKRKTDALQRDLGAYRFRGPIGTLLREFRFSTHDFQVLAVLLQHHLRSEDPAMEGRLLLGQVFETSFDVLASLDVLHETGPLRASGVVVIAEDEEVPDDILESRFRLSDDAVEAFRQEIAGFIPEDLQRSRRREYGSNRELLVDLRILHNLYRARSERVFNIDRWERVQAGSAAPGRTLTRRIEGFWQRIRSTLECTPKATEFPTVRFMRDYDLREEEMIMIVHLLFKELYEGNAYSDAAELVRLVSCGEESMIRHRELLLGTATLSRSEILENEPLLDGREMTGEVHLSDWVVNYLFGSAGDGQAIEADERLDWHLYLQNLDDAGTFFKDMEAN